MPDGLAAARSLGLDLDEAQGHPFRGIRFCDGDSAVEAAFPNGNGLGMRRTALHQMMVNRALDAGVRLAWGVRVTGIAAEGVMADGRLVRARWIAGADGGHSPVRRWAGLDGCHHESRRFGFRRHYHIAPWTECMEIHWGDRCQLYITPVADEEVCVVLISRDSHLRLDDALPGFPAAGSAVSRPPAPPIYSAAESPHRAAQSRIPRQCGAGGRRFRLRRRHHREGLCLPASAALQRHLQNGSAFYQAAHRRAGRRPRMMARLMLLLDRQRVCAAVRWEPWHAEHLFAGCVRGVLEFGFRRQWAGSGMEDADVMTNAANGATWLHLRRRTDISAPAGRRRAALGRVREPCRLPWVRCCTRCTGESRLKEGSLRFDPSTGRISGQVTVDARSSGNSSRDSRIAPILESDDPRSPFVRIA